MKLRAEVLAEMTTVESKAVWGAISFGVWAVLVLTLLFFLTGSWEVFVWLIPAAIIDSFVCVGILSIWIFDPEYRLDIDKRRGEKREMFRKLMRGHL